MGKMTFSAYSAYVQKWANLQLSFPKYVHMHTTLAKNVEFGGGGTTLGKNSHTSCFAM